MYRFYIWVHFFVVFTLVSPNIKRRVELRNRVRTTGLNEMNDAEETLASFKG